MQHPVGLAHDGVGVGGELQCVRQEHRVDGRALHGQGRQLGHHVHFAARTIPFGRDQRLAARATTGEQLARGAPGAQLQQFQPENVIQQPPQQLRLGLQQLPSERS